MNPQDWPKELHQLIIAAVENKNLQRIRALAKGITAEDLPEVKEIFDEVGMHTAVTLDAISEAIDAICQRNGIEAKDVLTVINIVDERFKTAQGEQPGLDAPK